MFEVTIDGVCVLVCVCVWRKLGGVGGVFSRARKASASSPAADSRNEDETPLAPIANQQKHARPRDTSLSPARPFCSPSNRPAKERTERLTFVPPFPSPSFLAPETPLLSRPRARLVTFVRAPHRAGFRRSRYDCVARHPEPLSPSFFSSVMRRAPSSS